LKVCTGIEILKISADANFEDPLTAPLNPRLNDGRQTLLGYNSSRTPSSPRGLVKPDVIMLVPGKTSVWVIRGGRGRPTWATNVCEPVGG